MANMIYRRPAGTGLTQAEKAMLEEAEKHPLEYDEDSPKLTPEQLAQFKPVGGMSWAERTRLMEAKTETNEENTAGVTKSATFAGVV